MMELVERYSSFALWRTWKTNQKKMKGKGRAMMNRSSGVAIITGDEHFLLREDEEETTMCSTSSSSIVAARILKRKRWIHR